jgi:hypothetical protein
MHNQIWFRNAASRPTCAALNGCDEDHRSRGRDHLALCEDTKKPAQKAG